MSALVGAAAALVTLVVSAVQERSWPTAEAVTTAVVAVIVAAGGVWADLQARKRAFAPSTVATSNPAALQAQAQALIPEI